MANTLSKQAELILSERYYKKDSKGNVVENWDGLCTRVAKKIAKYTDWETIRDNMYNLNFTLNTPALINLGRPEFQQQGSACFVTPIYPTEANGDFGDASIETILECNKWNGTIHKTGGGTGTCFSFVRPKGDSVRGVANAASGVVSFLRIFNATTEEIKQGRTRKGAGIAVLHIWHPEIEDFINCKSQEGKITNFNISIMVCDEFMKAVEDNEDWELRFNKNNPVDFKNGKCYKIVKARELWNKIVYGAWKNGEPGILFDDSINRANPIPSNILVSCNPCLHKDTYMQTSNGLEKITNVKNVSDSVKYHEATSWKVGIKKVVKVVTNSGFEYIVTPDHKFMLNDGEWCEAKDLLDKYIKFDIDNKAWVGYDPYPNADYRILGFELGDGNYHKASKRMKYIYATPDKDDEVVSIIERVFDDKFYVTNDNKKMINIPSNSVYANAFVGKINDRVIPDWVLQLPKKRMQEFLSGLFSANGSNLKKYHKIQLVSSNNGMLAQVQQMLLLFGIKAKLWVHNKSHDVKFSNGTFTCNTSYHLVLSRISYKIFLDTIGFIQTYKNGYNSASFNEETYYEAVVSIQDAGEAEVWDFSEPVNNYGISNGAYVHNCGEVPLDAFEACVLGSINLKKHVSYPSFGKGRINWPKLAATTRTLVRTLNGVIDNSEYPLSQIEEKVKDTRKIGVGVMGYHDALIMCGKKYNSVEGLLFGENILSFIKVTAASESTNLAREYGNFPAWGKSTFALDGIPRYNAATMAIAPTGSTARIADASFSIEPMFSPIYNSKIMDTEVINIHPILEQELGSRGLFNPKLIEKVSELQTVNIPEIPEDMRDLFVTATEISTEWHVKHLVTAQRHVDSAVSKTINMPNEATEEDVNNVYFEAWRNGAKGVTVYRNNSREKQVLNDVSLSMLSDKEKLDRGVCPGCLKSGSISHQGGCIECTSCAWTMCSL